MTFEAFPPGPDLKPGEPVATVPKGQKVGMDLALYAGRVMPETFGQVVEFAQMMCKGGLAIPKHLRDNPGSCLRVVQQSMAWEMDPWAVASKTYSVNDILAYESQLISAIIRKWAPIRERVIPYVFEGSGGDLRCTITVHHAETGEEITYKSPIKKDISPQNSPLWKSDPEQQISYYSIRALARRHFPEILMGVYDREEVLAMKDITPKAEVRNMLEDEPAVEVKGEVIPPERKVIKPGAQPLDQTKVVPGQEVAFDPESGEIFDPKDTEDAPAEPAPPAVPFEVQAENMLRYIAQETDGVMLAEWQNSNSKDINSLPGDLCKKVIAALQKRHKELEF